MSYIHILRNVIPLTNKYENPLMFRNIYSEDKTKGTNILSKENFFKSFDSEYNNLYHYKQYNFKYSNTLTSEIVVDMRQLGINGVASGVNYLHVINTDNASFPRDLFYFITNIDYLNGYTARLSIELDIFTTYFDKVKLSSSDKIYTERGHVDRFNLNGEFGCKEALFGDIIDGQFKANILAKRNKLFVNEKLYAIAYMSKEFCNNELNKPLTKGSSMGITAVGSYLVPNGSEVIDEQLYKDIPLPYYVAIIPITPIEIKVEASGTSHTYKYGLFQKYNNSENDITPYDRIKESPYTQGIQLVSFDFEIDFNSMYAFGLMRSLTGSGGYVVDTLMLGYKENAIEKVDSLIKKSIFNVYGDLTLSDTRNKYLEPKLFTSPYMILSLTSANSDEMEFELFNALENNVISFSQVFAPNTITSGQKTYITSGSYKHLKANYNGISPTLSSEIPYLSDRYQEFLATQRNSFYTGIGVSVGNNILNTIMGVYNNNGWAISGSVSDLLAKPFEVPAKMKDLKNAPSKASSSTFDVYSILGATDLNKYVNIYTLIDEEVEKVSDFYYLNGYQLETFRKCKYDAQGNIISDKDSLFTRSMFNFVKLKQDIESDLEYIGSIPLSINVRRKFNEIFNKGVRLWSSQDMAHYLNYDKENIEIFSGSPP